MMLFGLAALSFRIEVEADKLRVYRWFRWRTIPFSAIRGYRIEKKEFWHFVFYNNKLEICDLVGHGHERLLRVFFLRDFAMWVASRFEPVEARRGLARRARQLRQREQQQQQQAEGAEQVATTGDERSTQDSSDT